MAANAAPSPAPSERSASRLQAPPSPTRAAALTGSGRSNSLRPPSSVDGRPLTRPAAPTHVPSKHGSSLTMGRTPSPVLTAPRRPSTSSASLKGEGSLGDADGERGRTLTVPPLPASSSHRSSSRRSDISPPALQRRLTPTALAPNRSADKSVATSAESSGPSPSSAAPIDRGTQASSADFAPAQPPPEPRGTHPHHDPDRPEPPQLRPAPKGVVDSTSLAPAHEQRMAFEAANQPLGSRSQTASGHGILEHHDAAPRVSVSQSPPREGSALSNEDILSVEGLDGRVDAAAAVEQMSYASVVLKPPPHSSGPPKLLRLTLRGDCRRITVQALKEALSDFTGIAVDAQRLTKDGQVLLNNMLGADFALGGASVMYLDSVGPDSAAAVRQPSLLHNAHGGVAPDTMAPGPAGALSRPFVTALAPPSHPVAAQQRPEPSPSASAVGNAKFDALFLCDGSRCAALEEFEYRLSLEAQLDEMRALELSIAKTKDALAQRRQVFGRLQEAREEQLAREEAEKREELRRIRSLRFGGSLLDSSSPGPSVRSASASYTPGLRAQLSRVDERRDYEEPPGRGYFRPDQPGGPDVDDPYNAAMGPQKEWRQPRSAQASSPTPTPVRRGSFADPVNVNGGAGLQRTPKQRGSLADFYQSNEEFLDEVVVDLSEDPSAPRPPARLGSRTASQGGAVATSRSQRQHGEDARSGHSGVTHGSRVALQSPFRDIQ